MEQVSGHGPASPLLGFHQAEIKVWAGLHSPGSLTGEESAPKLLPVIGRIHLPCSRRIYEACFFKSSNGDSISTSPSL